MKETARNLAVRIDDHPVVKARLRSVRSVTQSSKMGPRKELVPLRSYRAQISRLFANCRAKRLTVAPCKTQFFSSISSVGCDGETALWRCDSMRSGRYSSPWMRARCAKYPQQRSILTDAPSRCASRAKVNKTAPGSHLRKGFGRLSCFAAVTPRPSPCQWKAPRHRTTQFKEASK